jgi:hypothetical protein
MSHFQLSEEQEHCIYHARYTLQLVIDLAEAIPQDRAVPIDPVGLSMLLCSVRDKLPTDKDMPFIAR